jgi:D-arabinose 1-dehydrogenase-like Zn-dependent alcohol dehydrogenase
LRIVLRIFASGWREKKIEVGIERKTDERAPVKGTYKAVEVSAPGNLCIVERPIPDPEDAAAAVQRLRGAGAILATGTSGGAMGPLVWGLAARGKFIVVGVPQDSIQLNAFPLVFGGRSIYGSLTGTPIDSEDTLAFSVLENIRPMIETAPLERAADAYTRMMQGKARFRMVLVTEDGVL